jgi:ubiquinone biosynthesis protein
MASRKFKETWIPTPLDVPVDVVVKPKRERPRPVSALRRIFVMLWYFVVVMFRAVAVRLFPSLGRGRYSLSANGRYARAFVERMGGMWVMMARLASMRTDLLGADFCRELEMTRDRAAPLPLSVVRQVIDAELRKRGTTIDEALSEIVERPLSTRAFSQFHRARLKESGSLVVVRVRPPDAVRRSKIDLAYLSFFIGLLERVGYLAHVRWKALLYEAKKATEDQLDFRAEESEVRRISKLLRPRRIYVPRVYRRYTGEGLLISEFIRGVSVEDLRAALLKDADGTSRWMEENDIDRRRVCRRLFNAHLELLFEHNLFYTELLSHNVILLKKNRIALISLNTVEKLDASLLNKYRLLYRALAAKDFTKVCDTYLAMGPPLPRKDLSEVRTLVTRALHVWESRTYIKTCAYEEKSLTAAMQRLAVCAGQCGLPASWDLTRLHFAEKTLDQSLETLDQGLNFMKAIRRYDRDAQFRTIENAATKDVGKRIRNMSDVLQVNMQLAENFEFDNDYLRRRMMGFQGTIGRAGKVAGRIVRMLSRVLVAVMVLYIFTYIKERYDLEVGPEKGEGAVGRVLGALPVQNPWIWLILLGALFYLWRFLRGLYKELAKEDVRPIGTR